MLLCNTSPTIQVSCHLVLTCPSCDTFKVGPLAPCPGQTQVLAVSVTACLIWLHLDFIPHSQPNSSKSSVIGVQVTALAELQQAPALTPAHWASCQTWRMGQQLSQMRQGWCNPCSPCLSPCLSAPSVTGPSGSTATTACLNTCSTETPCTARSVCSRAGAPPLCS